jgi:hypothetical protein
MRTGHSIYTFESSGARRELIRLIRRIQALTIELEKLRRAAGTASEVEAKERTRDQLHWRLAMVARRTATDYLGNAA